MPRLTESDSRLESALAAEIEERNRLIAEINAILPPVETLTIAQRAKLVLDALRNLYDAVLKDVDMDATSESLGIAVNDAKSVLDDFPETGEKL